jgi:hypothetical protein
MTASLKILLLLCCGLFLFHSPGRAQLPRNSVKVGYAVVAIQQLNIGFSSSQSSSRQEEYRLLGPINVSYARTVARRVQVGITGTYVRESTTITYTNSTPASVREDRAETRAIMPLIGFIWMQSEKYSLYSNYMVGVNFWKETRAYGDLPVQEKRETREAYQLNVIGMTYGGRLKGFAEFGVGIAGVVNAGMAIDF